MTIKDRILRVLDEKGLKYSDLIDDLNINDDDVMNEFDILDESELDKLIESLDTTLLERVSKILGIPLYSFYYDPNKVIIKSNESKFYNKDIWKDDKKNPLD